MSTGTDSCLRLAGIEGRKAVDRGHNFVFSPLSIRGALGLLALGSKGKTLEQLLSFLGFQDISDLNTATANILKSLILPKSGTPIKPGWPILNYANSIWVDQSLSLKPDFEESTASHYLAEAKSVDFQNQTDEVVEEINNWIEKKTEGLIKNLIHNLDQETKLIIANALYFRAAWLDPFEKSATKDAEFHLLDRSTVIVPFMTSHEDQYIAYFEDFVVFKLRYNYGKDNRWFSMLIFLPDERDGLSELMDKMISTPNFIKLHYPRRTVRVSKFMLPKFKFSFHFEASESLKSTGLEAPFSMGEADLSEFFSLPPVDDLFISAVIHKATIEVDEEGTTAAAATATCLMGCSMFDPPPLEFVADHPFIFAITEAESEALLFLGHVLNPTLQD